MVTLIIEFLPAKYKSLAGKVRKKLGMSSIDRYPDEFRIAGSVPEDEFAWALTELKKFDGVVGCKFHGDISYSPTWSPEISAEERTWVPHTWVKGEPAKNLFTRTDGFIFQCSGCGFRQWSTEKITSADKAESFEADISTILAFSNYQSSYEKELKDRKRVIKKHDGDMGYHAILAGSCKEAKACLLEFPQKPLENVEL